MAVPQPEQCSMFSLAAAAPLLAEINSRRAQDPLLSQSRGTESRGAHNFGAIFPTACANQRAGSQEGRGQKLDASKCRVMASLRCADSASAIQAIVGNKKQIEPQNCQFTPLWRRKLPFDGQAQLASRGPTAPPSPHRALALLRHCSRLTGKP